jgi:hypothetical protein
MNIQQKVKSVLSRQMGSLGAEKIEIDGQTIYAIPAEVDTDRDMMGGSRENRDVDYQFPTDDNIKLRKGAAVNACGKKWKVENFRQGRAMTTISLIEPNRIQE